MLILLSPAKQLDFTPAPSPMVTQPVLADRTRVLAHTTRALSQGDIKSLMDLSDDLARLNRERFQAFDPDAPGSQPAAFAFAGEVYRGLDARTLSHEDLEWAQDRLRILSGLYGVLRPLDAIQPYRLEMGTRLKTRSGATLYDFWRDDIARSLKRDLEGQAAPAVVNLASQEYARAARLPSLGAPVISVDFKEEKDGQLRALMVFAKKARGMMARWIIENRIEDPEALTRFDCDGYRLAERDDRTGALLFTRPQPVKKD